MQIGRHNRIDGLGLHGHAYRHRIDQQFVPGNIRKTGSNLCRDFVPQHHGVALGVGFRYHGKQFPGARTRQCKGEAHNALYSVAGKHGNFSGNFFR